MLIPHSLTEGNQDEGMPIQKQNLAFLGKELANPRPALNTLR